MQFMRNLVVYKHALNNKKLTALNNIGFILTMKVESCVLFLSFFLLLCYLICYLLCYLYLFNVIYNFLERRGRDRADPVTF